MGDRTPDGHHAGMSPILSKQQIDHWKARGWLVLGNVVPHHTSQSLVDWVDRLAQSPGPNEQRLHYFEQTDCGRMLCRTERYLEDHAELRRLICEGTIPQLVGDVLGEPAVIYKEKVNYKSPGGAGFNAHQDATAYAHARHHVTCLIAVDEMTPQNGCLEFALGEFDGLLPDNGDGCLPAALEERQEWFCAQVPAGGIVLFSSLVPHRSGPNMTCFPRRALYLTYNRASEGDQRASYYRARAGRLAAAPARDGPVRLSTIGHFRGRHA